MLRRFLNAVCLLLAFSQLSCGNGSGRNIKLEDLKISGLTAAYDPDAGLVRISWLEIVHKDIVGFSVKRSDPVEITEPIPENVGLIDYADVGRDEFLLEDNVVDISSRYGYKVAIILANPNAVTTPIESEIIWADIPGPIDPAKLVAGIVTDVCTAVTAESFINRFAMIPFSDNLDAAQAASSESIRLDTRIFEERSAQLSWRSYPVNTPFASIQQPDPDNVKNNFGVPINKVLKLKECNNDIINSWSFNHRTDQLAPSDYALAAELRLFGKGNDINKLDGPYFRVVFQNDNATESLGMSDVAPPPGSALRQGIQIFTTDLNYNLKSKDGKILSAQVVSVDDLGNEKLIDVATYDLIENAGTFLYSSPITIPSSARFVRFIGRIGTGALEDVYVQDEIDYAVVP